MNYRQMLDEFEYLDKRLSHLEHENKYLRERIAKLEGQVVTRAIGPQFTSGTLPDLSIICQYNTMRKPQRNYGSQEQE